MGSQEVVVRAVVMDEVILEREGVQLAARAPVPGDFLHLARQPSARHHFLDHHHLPVGRERGGDAVLIERLERMDRHKGDAFARLLEPLG